MRTGSSYLGKEARVQVELIHYSTGMHALKEFAEGRNSAIDLVVVADVLPMLPLQEFVDAVQKLHPGVHVVVAGERTRLPSKLQVRKSEFYVKPLSPHDLRSLLMIASLENSAIAASRS